MEIQTSCLPFWMLQSLCLFKTFGMFQTAEVTAARPEKDENAPAWSLDSKSAESRKANFGEMIFEG